MFVDGLLEEIPKFNPKDLYAFSTVVARLFEIRSSNYTVSNELEHHNAPVQCTSNSIVFLQGQKVTMAG